MNLSVKPNLQGKVAVITGGAGVLCSEFARALAQCGAKVALIGRTMEPLQAVADAIKADSPQAVKELQGMGIRVVMLTGDNAAIGNAVTRELGLDACYAELLPGDKVTVLEKLDGKKRAGSKLAFVGDGINDAPVLARADIGIAMGGLASDAAIEAADVVLMTDEPMKLVEAIEVAKETRKIARQNIVFALGIKAVFLVLGAFGLVGMWIAVFGDVGVALLAVLNAMRILKK